MIDQGVANMITIDELKFKLGGLETAVNDLRDALSIEASDCLLYTSPSPRDA